MEIYHKASKTDSGPFSMLFPRGLKNKRGADAAGSGGRRPLKGVDPASRRLGQGERQGPRRGCLRPAPPAPKAASGRFLNPLHAQAVDPSVNHG